MGYGGWVMMVTTMVTVVVVVVMALHWWVRLRGKAEDLQTEPH